MLLMHLHVLPVIVAMLAGAVMMKLGLNKSALELRRRRRICPSCGRELQVNRCRCND